MLSFLGIASARVLMLSCKVLGGLSLQGRAFVEAVDTAMCMYALMRSPQARLPGKEDAEGEIVVGFGQLMQL